MKKVNLLLIASVMAIFTIGCKSITEKVSEKVIESAIGHDADIEIDKDGNTTLTVKGEDGEEVTLSANSNEIPDNFPSDIYFVKGEIIVVSSMNTSGGDIITVSMYVDGEPAELSKDIIKNMKENGWKTEMNTSTPEASMIVFSKDKKGATITIGDDDGKTAVSYMVTL